MDKPSLVPKAGEGQDYTEKMLVEEGYYSIIDFISYHKWLDMYCYE